MDLSQIRGKRVLILGLGLHGGGVGAAAFFAARGARVMVTDLKSKKELAPSLKKLKRFKNIAYHLGGHRMADLRNTDLIIQNPGVPERSLYLLAARRKKIPILSDVEVFFRLCPAEIIGITGTKGKTTTTSLVGAFLKAEGGRRVWVGGNIRTSVLELLPKIRRGNIAVLELSSFQLDALARSHMSPRTAVITNIFPDHLNRYATMGAYVRSKAQIFKFQGSRGALFIPAEDKRLRHLSRQAPGRVVRVPLERTLAPVRAAIPHSVPGFHWIDIALAVAVAQHFGAGDRAIRSVLKNFHGVPGRMEAVRVHRGVRWINDTTATNPGAAAFAVAETKSALGEGSLHVIAGGYDKGLPIREFCRALRTQAASAIFLPGTATERMIRELKAPKSLSIMRARTMAEAVRVAARIAKAGDAVLLSPGAASFGLFQHEFDRGDQFTQAVKGLR
ncbi:UDP-N-acetylmuramoyl-L-alanine--D-glutamate ligase [Candidatus Parcubacteria bacterium]|nr:MAG: UDP-N-acetylmuramoyl-L-alanine--D-glutamate ligase [Candidatus Parcubacteria bacterium]